MLSKDSVEVGNLSDGGAAADADPQLVFGQFGRGEGEIDFAGFAGTQMDALESAELAHGVVRPAGAGGIKLDHFVALAGGRVPDVDGNLRAAGRALGVKGGIVELGVGEAEAERVKRVALEIAVRAALHGIVFEGRQLFGTAIKSDGQAAGRVVDAGQGLGDGGAGFFASVIS